MQSPEGSSSHISSPGICMSTRAPVVSLQHGYPPIVQYVEGRETFFPTVYNQDYQLPTYPPPRCGGSEYIHSQAESQVTTNMVSSGNVQRLPGFASRRTSHLCWLNDNLEMAGAGTLSRCSMYKGYLHYCQEHKLEPLNKPNFGKLIHSVFPDLKARRLGTRGNSRYHYYGIRVKSKSPLSKLQEDPLYTVAGHQPVKQEQSTKDQMSDHLSGGCQKRIPEQLEAAQSQHQRQRLTQRSLDLPEFPNLDHLSHQLLLTDKLQILYRKNCVAILDAVKNLQFQCVGKLWQSFWCPTVGSIHRTTDIPNSIDVLEGMIPRDSLVDLCKNEDVRMWIRSCDMILYEAMVEFLVPDVLCQVPAERIRQLHNFANNAEGWTTNAMRDFPQEVLNSKVEVVRVFSQVLRQYISLNQLARTARSHLRKTSTVNKMIADLNMVKFGNIQKQASWVCQCDEGVFQRLEENFKASLMQSSGDQQWATCLDDLVSQVLHNKCLEDARQFLLKWSYYSSKVIMDLTLRSAATFGPCHIIRMFYNEFLLYVVARHVAKVNKQLTIAVIGEFNYLSCPVTTKDSSSGDMSDRGSKCPEQVEKL